MEMISLGAGLNSVAMTIVMVKDGWRGYIVFSDTGGEKPDTYCYLDYFEREFLAPRGLGIVRLQPGSPFHGAISAVPLEEYCLREARLPLLGMRWCSSKWKGRPLDKWAKAHGVERQFLGISADEAHRTRRWPESKAAPLVDQGINRQGCRKIILDAGLIEPLWSSCFFCPGQTYGEWRYIHDHLPELWERAKQMEKNARERRNPEASLSYHMTLEEMEGRGWGMQLGFDLTAWMPCVCRL